MTIEQSSKKVPGPRSWPLLGNALDLLKGQNQCAYDAIRKLSREYGEFFKIKLPPGRTVYISTNPKHLREVMVTRKDEFPKGDTLTELRSLGIGSRGLLVVEGAEWEKQRSIAKPAFKNIALKSYFDIYSSNAMKAIELIGSEGVFDVFDLTNRITLAVTCETAFSYTPSSMENMLSNTDPLVERLNLMFEQLLIRNQRSGLWKYLPIPSNYKVKAAAVYLNEFFHQIIEKRRAGENRAEDLLALLMESKNENNAKLDDGELIDQMFVVLAGGQDSTSTALGWLFCFLAQNPEIDERVYQEIQSCAQDNEAITFEVFQSLEYLNQVASETLRLRPPFPILFRSIPKQTEIDGFDLEAGSWITFLLPELQRREDLWGENSDEFNPDNFSIENRKIRKKDAYVPFGLGPRMCIGNQMAMMELVAIASLILKQYRFELVSDQNLYPYMRFSWGVKQGAKLKAYQR